MNKFFKAIKLIKNPSKLVVRLNEHGFSHLFSDKFFLKCAYKYSFGKELDLDDPKTFNEKLQWLKLYNRKPEYTKMVDKYEAKKYVADIIGEEYIVPTLGVWDRVNDIDFDKLPNKFVLKCTHDSGGLVICRDKSTLDLVAVKKKLKSAMKRKYFWVWREWPYKNVKPRIIAEEYIEDNSEILQETSGGEITYRDLQRQQGLLDYKFMCFGGEVKALFLDIGVIGNSEGHAEQYFRNIYDRSGNIMPFRETRENYPIPVILPENLSEMVDVAEKLSKNIPHVRVDLYRLSDGTIKVGEMTFFHGSGLFNFFIPEEWDRTLGDWIELQV